MPWPWDRIPPWATSLIGRQLYDLSDRLKQPDFVAGVRERIDRAIAEVPEVAVQKVEQVVRSAKKAAESVQRWADNRTAPVVTGVNASGVVFPHAGIQPPLAVEVSMAWAAAANAWAEFSADVEVSRAQRAIRGRTDSLVGCSTRVAASWTLAIAAAAKLREGSVVVPRCFARRVGTVGPLPDVLRSFGIAVEEIGSANGLDDLGDFQSSSQSTVFFWIDDVGQLSSLQHPAFKDSLRIVIAPRAWPIDGNLSTVAQPLTVAMILESGAKAVVIPGNGLLGGPTSGLIFAANSLLDRLDTQTLWRSMRADVPTHAALVTAMDIWLAGQAPQRIVPVAIIASSLDNVRYRAAQLRTRLEAIEGLEIETVEGESRIWPDTSPTLPTVHLRLKRTGTTAESWQQALASGTPVIWANVDEGALVLDVRTIEPNCETVLVAALGGDSNVVG